jgi:alpha-tubulin suppressor-like RCC1 family protein
MRSHLPAFFLRLLILLGCAGVPSFAQTFSVSAGATHSVATGYGYAWSWGANTSGQLGDTTLTARLQPGPVIGSGGFPDVLSMVTSISAGTNHNLTLSYPSAKAWGDNAYGQLGHNDTVDAHRPQTYFVSDGIDSEFKYVELSAGSNHSLLRNEYGQVWESGLAASLGLASNVLWPVHVLEGTANFAGATAIAAGGSHSLAIRDGKVYSWGTNTNLQLGYAGASRSTVAQVVAIPTATTIVAIAAGGTHSMALDSAGSIWTWGGNVYGQLGVGSTTATGGLAPQKLTVSGVTFLAIAAGAHFSAALDASGNVWTWGRNAQGQLGYAVSGTALGNQLVPKQIPSFGNIIAIGSGPAASHTLAVKNTGEVWAWGLNASGQLGTGITETIARWAPPAPCSGLYLISQAPVVSIKTPLTGTTVAAATNVAVDVSAIDANGIAHVDLAIDGVVVATDTTFPLTLTWENAVAGTHQLTAIAYNTRGQQTTSTAVQLIVSAPPAGGKVAAPVVSVEGGVYATGQDIIVRAPTPSSVIHYTSNGIDPIETDPTIASGTVLWVDHTTTLRFRAFLSGATPSEIKEARYRISGAVAAGSNHTVTVDAASRIWTWGDNSQSQLGRASTAGDSKTPIQLDCYEYFAPALPATVWAGGTHTAILRKDGSCLYFGDVAPATSPGLLTTVAPGKYHYIVARTDGRVASWGDNSKGQLGDGSTTDRAEAQYVNFLGGVVDVAAGEFHSVAVRSDGSVWTWGDNLYGQLGLDPAVVPKSSVPMRVTLLNGKDVVAVASGLSHCLAVLRDGTVYAWGRNQYHQVSSAAGLTVYQPTLVPGLTGVTAIAGGTAHNVACTQDGSVYTWGYNTNGELGNGGTAVNATPTKIPGIYWAVSVAAGANHTSVVTEDGVVWSFGYNNNGQVGDNTLVSKTNKTVTVNLRLTGAFNVSAGQDHTLALQDTGMVWSWGINANGQLGFADHSDGAVPRVIPGLEGIVSIAAGGNFSLALGSEGRVYSWGANDMGQLGNATTVDRDTPTAIAGLTNMINIGAGRNFGLACDLQNHLWLWGNWQTGYSGGAAIYTNYTTPQLIANGTTPLGHVLTAGENHIALLSGSLVVVGGSNLYGQLGQGNNFLSTYGFGYSPSGLSNVIDVASGDNHVVALKADGTVWCWGRNQFGQLGDNTGPLPPPNPGPGYKAIPTQVKSSTTLTPLSGAQTTVVSLTGVVGVAASGDTSFAIKSDGSIWAWGANDTKFGAFPGLDQSWAAVKVVAASATLYRLVAGHNHVVALQRDGTVQSWGTNDHRQLGFYNPAGGLAPGTIPDFDLLFNDDADGDGFTLQQEIGYGTDPLHWNTYGAAGLDSDGDGIPDDQEVISGTDPHLADTDHDGVLDGLEKTLGLSSAINDAVTDSDGDGMSNLEEALRGTNPANGVNLTVFTRLE